MLEALFSGCPSVRACIRPGVRPVSTSHDILETSGRNFSKLADDVFEVTNELVRF